jgi:hypothetical protein
MAAVVVGVFGRGLCLGRHSGRVRPAGEAPGGRQGAEIGSEGKYS